MTNTNPCSKTRPQNDPYESWEVPGIGIYHVLKKYQGPAGEAKNPAARWFTLCENEYMELGDMYAAEIKRYGRQIYIDPRIANV
jgi:hypothetical protein